MAEERSRPGTPAWKKAVPQAGRKDSARPAWRKEPEAGPAPRSRWGRRTKLGLGALGLALATAGVVAVISLIQPPKPGYLVLLGTDYLSAGQGQRLNLAIPHNAYGWQGLKMLEATTGDVVAIKDSPREYRKDLSWYKSLSQVKQKTVIVYLALHGGADAEGKQPYLLPQEADVCEPDRRVWLRDILAQLAEIGDDKNKLLILDATQVGWCWPLGMLHNDFARALQSPEIKDLIQKTPRLVVLCSSDADQRSWVDEQWGCTVFAHFVAEGLRGAADRASDSPNDRVNALKLAQYVKENVRRWVYNNRGELQTPVLVGGEDRAKLIELSHVRNYVPSEQGSSERKVPSDYLTNITKAWEHCQELEKATPAPLIYTPQRWRQYLDAMLLYEQLVRAGSDKQQLVQAELKAIEEDIRAGREKQDLSSTENAVAMPACLGLPLPWPEAEKAYDRLESLLRAPPNEREKRWQELSHEVSHKQGEQLARARLSGGLIDWVAENPSKANLERANDLLHVMRAIGNQRSAEAHFLAMLRRDLDKTPENYWSLALKLRRLAEDAALGTTAEQKGHPYSERIFPWIRAKVEHADQLRQHGQDLLFASSAESWDEGRGLLQQARNDKSQGNGYEAAQKDAAVVHEALETCQRVLAVAPYYAHWLAAQEPAVDSELNKMEELLEQTHYLSRQLRGEPGDSPVPMAERIRKAIAVDPEDRRALSLADRAAEVRQSLAEIDGRFLQQCRDRVATVLGKTQSSWRQVEDALAVPLLPPELRRQLLNRAEDIAREFHEAARDEKKESTAGITDEKNRERAGYRAGREGRMALATLGQKWFGDDEYFKANRSYREILRSLRDISPEAEWQKGVRHAGEEIAVRWRALPKRINELTEKSRKERLDQAELDLSLAEDLTRQLESGLTGYLQRDPVGSCRDVRLHNFLLWQAGRTWQDHWFAENGDEDPYYCAAGNRYTHDARTLVEGGRQELDPAQTQARLSAVEAMEKRFVPGKLEAIPHETVRPELTDEVRFSLAYSLKPDVPVPAGAPVVWLTPDPKFLRLGDKLSQGRHVLPTPGDKPTKEEAFNLDVPSPSVPWLRPHTDEASVLLEGRYRGQIIRQKTPVNIHRLPDLVWYEHPGPLSAAIAVRADKEIHEQYAPYNGALAVVLDCTGSMYPEYATYQKEVEDRKRDAVPDFTPQTPCKYHRALQALKKVLSSPRLEKGTTVSLFVFGHAKGRTRNAPTRNQPNPTPEMEPSERTREIKKMIEMVRPPSAWDRTTQLESLMQKLDLFPFNETPLVRAMVQAKEEGFPADFKGFKTMLVITDGEDNLFKLDTDLHQRHGTENIGEFIEKEFKGSGIRPVLIGYGVPKNEQEQLVKEFQTALLKLEPRGYYYSVDDLQDNVADLVDKLQRRFRQDFRYFIQTVDGTPVKTKLLTPMPEDGYRISRTGESYSEVFLEPGTYRVSVQMRPMLEKLIRVERGDYLRLKIVANDLVPDLERVLMGNDYAAPSRHEEADWLLTIPQNQRKQVDATLSLQMMLGLENRNLRGKTLEEIRPDKVWLELKPQGLEEQRIGLRWGTLPGYPGPAWDLRVSDWPKRPSAEEAARPVLSAWWTPPARRKTGLVNDIGLRKNGDLSTLVGEERPIGQAAQDKIRIESVEALRWLPEGAVEPVPALAVRLRYPPRKPAWVEIEGPKFDAQEHRFYHDAGKCTSLFWPVSEADAKYLLKALHVYSLENFKDQALHKEIATDELPDNHGRPAALLFPR